MSLSRAAPFRRAARSAARVPHPEPLRPRDWFLTGSRWEDSHWTLAPTSILHADRPIIIRWDFALHVGSLLFTHPRYAALLESAKRHVALFRTRSHRFHSGCGGETLRAYFQCLRAFIRWMSREQIERFADLDAALIADFTRTIKRRRGYTGPTISREALRNHYAVLVGLYRHRHSVEDALQVDPFPGLSAHAATASRAHNPQPNRYTPDAVAIPLLHRAIELIDGAAVPILAARERYVRSYQRARMAAAGDRRGAHLTALSSLNHIVIDTPRGSLRLDSRRTLPMLIDRLYGACFAIISYLVGPRISELIHFQAGCVQPLDKPGSEHASGVAAIVGAIYKAESYHGRPHRWVAPPPALHAIAVLEALSAPHRARSGRADLWQRPRARDFGIDEWLPDSPITLRVSDTRSANERVNRLSRWLRVPRYKGHHWRFTSHQGRKTFARFVALRDRTALHALAQHLGHRDISQTDSAYVGTDYQLEREIDTAVLDQSVSAWEQMLTARSLGGRMGAEVLARRPRFRGAGVKQEIRAYARMLAETGLTLGVCEWGYCVYREEFSACRGSATAPDPVRREPSTCARCKNFSVTLAHRPYWTEQLDRYETLLNDPRLPAQTLKIARGRFDEARSLIRSLDSRSKRG
jgi:integrase